MVAKPADQLFVTLATVYWLQDLFQIYIVGNFHPSKISCYYSYKFLIFLL